MMGNADNTGSTPSRPAEQSRALVQTIEALLGLKPAALDAVQPLLADLAGIGEEGLSRAGLRRLATRMYCVQRYRVLRRTPEHDRQSSRVLLDLVSQEATALAPGKRCSRRSIQLWIRAWNAPGPDGVALGWRGLIHPCMGEQRRRFGRSGRKPSRSPEARNSALDRAFDGGSKGVRRRVDDGSTRC